LERTQRKQSFVNPESSTLTLGEGVNPIIDNRQEIYIEYKIAETNFYAINIAK
jgi:hypothetical protein